ncbi:MAG: hypothetical protein WC492_00390 [Candidatus Micrarchaeia archaeon]
MPTVAHVVQKYVRMHPHLEDFIERDIVSFHRLARVLRPDVETELGKEVEEGAIVMALSRMREKMADKGRERLKGVGLENLQISLRSDAMQIDLKKTGVLAQKLQKIQDIAQKSQEDILSITQSTHEVTIISQSKYEKKILEELKGEKILSKESGLSLLVLRFGEDVLYQPGFFDRVLRELSWENINIYEIVSTLTELIIVLKDEQAAKAYDVLRKKMKKKN